MKKEIWMDIPGYEGIYQASDFGEVKSLSRVRLNGKNNATCIKKEFLMTFTTDKFGYYRCKLCKNKQRKIYHVSQLVTMTFLGHIPCGHKLVVDHIDGNILNNSVENLRIVTTRENSTTCFRKNIEAHTSQYIGVGWNKSTNKWRSRIQINGKSIHLGSFKIEKDAGLAYITKLKELNNENLQRHNSIIAGVA